MGGLQPTSHHTTRPTRKMSFVEFRLEYQKGFWSGATSCSTALGARLGFVTFFGVHTRSSGSCFC